MILVIAEQRDGKLNRATWETIAAAQTLGGGNMPIKVVVLGPAGGVPQELAGGGVAEVLVGDHPTLALYTPDAFTMALQGIVESAAPQFVLLPHTYQTRDFAPRLAARMRKPLITDVTGIKGTGTSATFTRPMFQGKLAAEVKPVGDAPSIVTFQIGAFRADAVKKSGTAPVTTVNVAMEQGKIRQKPEARSRKPRGGDLSQADVS